MAWVGWFNLVIWADPKRLTFFQTQNFLPRFVPGYRSEVEQAQMSSFTLRTKPGLFQVQFWTLDRKWLNHLPPRGSWSNLWKLPCSKWSMSALIPISCRRNRLLSASLPSLLQQFDEAASPGILQAVDPAQPAQDCIDGNQPASGDILSSLGQGWNDAVADGQPSHGRREACHGLFRNRRIRDTPDWSKLPMWWGKWGTQWYTPRQSHIEVAEVRSWA